ncbi:MAG: helicase [Actinobacteria bacterium]|jgi:DNA excision repair protein ERCC-3|uniref:DNA 3'-5' helicase n=1 Tax=freshwater metagenome TaxID=449393 RepID=A0A6J6CEU1_9ZZZZ|nr:helicase [Actinomycetota bacterium]MSZ23121.1 helicase [Actinomycetota bacterium]MTA91964.1 helicase [Actinomycetota bacterium]
MTSGPLIVQSDKTALLEVDHPQAKDARHDLAIFAELERAPEHIHTYRITKLGLWNARAAGHDSDFVLNVLDRYAKFAVPAGVRSEIAETMNRYGRLSIRKSDDGELELYSTERAILLETSRHRKIADLLDGEISTEAFRIRPWARGQVKQELLKLGWPAEDFAGFTEGTPHEIALSGADWKIRDYQIKAVEKFWEGGSGVVVLPCGAGKTIVGAAAMSTAKTNTLILVTNTVSARQWKAELLKRTTLTEEEIGEYSGSLKEVKPVTIATYQILTTKRKGEYAHLSLLNANDWGLIVYDEVHLLPAPIFKMTADLQARRRLGLTATLVREDGKEGDVFSLIGPKRFDAPWKEIESQGYIAPAACFEVRIDLPDEERMNYAVSSQEDRYRIAATSATRIPVIKKLIAKHLGEPTLVIGQYLSQIHEVSAALDVPEITGDTPVDERERLFEEFRSGRLNTLVVSKVANFSVDLPEASVAIQISGSYGSRQEEAQRLGRLLRPKSDGRTASFYTLTSRDTVDQDFAQNRQRFLAEQGYSYEIVDAHSL